MLCFDPSPKSIIPTRALSGEKSVKSVKVPFFYGQSCFFCVSAEYSSSRAATVACRFISYSLYLATAALRTCVRKKPPLVRSITCW